jgi:uncharacterized protein (TIGR03437 family)
MTVAGFGTSDITVRQMWVLSPASIVMNVTVSPNAKPGTVQVTVATGLQMVTHQTVLEIHVPEPGTVSVRVPMLNPDTGMHGVPAGGKFLIEAAGLPEDLAGWSVKVGGLEATFVRAEDGRLLVDVPAGIGVGPAAVELTAPGIPAIPPVLMQIDWQPPQILALVGAGYIPPDDANPVRAGDRIAILVTGLGDSGAGAAIAVESLEFRLGEARLPAAAVVDALVGVSWVELVLPEGSASEELQWLRIGRGTRVSAAWGVSIHPALPKPEPPPVVEEPPVVVEETPVEEMPSEETPLY